MKKQLLNRYFLVLMFLLICFLPSAITREGESESDAIITAIGIDKLDNSEGLEVSLQVLVPTPSAQYSQQLSVVSTKEKTVSRAISFLELRLGKYISFPHCKAIVFNDNAMQEGVDKYLDYIVRNKANSNNIVLINAQESAKEMLNSISDIDNSLYFSLNNSGGFNKEYLKGSQISLGDFYKAFQTKDSSCIVGEISLEKASDVGMISIPSMSGGNNANNSGESSQNAQMTVVNQGESSLVKNGKKIMKLSAKQTRGFNWFSKDSNKGFLLIENVDDKLYKDATVGVEIERKTTTVKTYFEGKTPVYELDITLYIRVAEIVEEVKEDEIYDESHSYLTTELKNKIKEKVSGEISEAITLAKEHNADVMNAGKTINKYNNKKYKEYLKTNSKNPLQNIKFKTKITLKERL